MRNMILEKQIEPHTVEELAREYGLFPEVVRQCQKRAALFADQYIKNYPDFSREMVYNEELLLQLQQICEEMEFANERENSGVICVTKTVRDDLDRAVSQ